jgi:putative SOS response-associated peptidase YedK
MPVILQPDNFNLWLNKNMHDPEQLKPLYRPFPSELMQVRKVSAQVNNPRFDAPTCIAQV